MSTIWYDAKCVDRSTCPVHVSNKLSGRHCERISTHLYCRQEGDVSWTVYWMYIKQLGLLSSLGVTVLLFGGQAVSVASDWWLALWSRAGNQADLK